jgi:uncharacterized protein YdhG (YjbR/CyaY superfamily)
MEKSKTSGVDPVGDYISGFPEETAAAMEKIRKIIKDTVPEASELFAYNMPAYKLKGKPLIYFAGFKNHIGLYALPKANEAFSAELSNYKHGKGSIQFQLNELIPYDLIKQIVIFRVFEVTGK